MVISNQSYRHYAIIALVSAIVLLSGLSKIEINIMEARNFISAREMVDNHEFLLTTLNGQPRYEKPPLPTWLTAISGSIFGFDSLFALRLPVVLITFLLVFAIYFISIRMGLSAKHALYNSLISITSFYIFFSGRDNQWDMYANSFMLVGILFLWKVLQENSNQVQNMILSGLFLGFSILSKGPVALYALFLPFLISYVIMYRIPRVKWKYLAGMLLLGVLIGGSWYVYVRLKDPVAFQSIASRETANWTSYEVKPFYYYWSFFLQSGLWAVPSLISLIYPYLKTQVSNLKAYQFTLLWTILGLLFLSAIPEKKVRYLVPVLIPLAINTGFYLEYLIRCFNANLLKCERVVIYIFSGIIAIVGIAYPAALFFVLKEKYESHLLLCIFSSIALLLCASLIIRGLIKYKFETVFYSMIGLFSVAVFALVPLSKEIVFNPDYNSAKNVLKYEEEFRIKTYSLTAVGPEIVWDFGKPIPVIEKEGEKSLLPSEQNFGLLVDVKDSAMIEQKFPDYQIKKLYRINVNYKKGLKERLAKDYYLFSKANQ